MHRLGLCYVESTRSNHGEWLGPSQHIRKTRWRPFKRVFTHGSSEQRFIRETIYGSRRPMRYYQITTDPTTLPKETARGHHDQSTGSNRMHGGQHLWTADLSRIRLQACQG